LRYDKISCTTEKNPQDLVAPDKFYATAIADGEVDFEFLADQIVYETTLTESDCIAVLFSLERNILRNLEQGKGVKVGRLGSFNVTLKSVGKNTSAEVSATDILKGRVRFRPGKKLSKMSTELRYHKVN